MYINKPSKTKIDAADRVNLLHSTSCRFEQYKSSKPGQIGQAEITFGGPSILSLRNI